ncbi:Cell division cycle protein 20-like [Oopsacas minuta]|uniref:Cell division cycle protein 20-like n=1 Tax=Oopsacas minuta TaxID=111878 RepID=A0AAV7K1S7_9METZ|nr:Cell division cycle protein 20-like [Oopsacas minuta]
MEIGDTTKHKIDIANQGKKPTFHTPNDCLRNTSSRPKTPQFTEGDRFIPNRKTTDFDSAHQQLIQSAKDNMDSSLSQANELITKQLNSKTPERILSYNCKVPECDNTLSIYTSQKLNPKYVNRSARYIPKEPTRILDAPDVINDYYLNLLDWNSNNMIAVGLGTAVYIWNASNGIISKLCEYHSPEYPSSLSWSASPKYLAVGTSNREVQIWDTETLKLIRTMLGHTFRIGSLAWNTHLLTSGSQNGFIIHHDPRVPDHIVCYLSKHSQEVCGLKWSPDMTFLASGGNDNLLCIWDVKKLTTNEPLHTSSLHIAAVKALAWCPWKNCLLASGGGTADRHLRIWNAQTGKCFCQEDTGSQISGIVWSERYKEIVTSHGYSKNQLNIWRYPSIQLVGELTGHSQRILSTVLSPNERTIATLGADESLRFWDCFQEVQPKLTNKIFPATKSQISHSL